MNRNRVVLLFCLFSFLWAFAGDIKPPKEQKEKKETGYSPEEELALTALFIDAKKESLLGNYTEAMASFKQLLEKNPTHAPTYFELSKLYIQLNQIGMALELIKQAVKLDEANYWYKIDYVKLLSYTGRYKEAEVVYKELYRLNPSDETVLYEWVNMYIYQKKWKDAIGLYNLLEEKNGVSEEWSIRKYEAYITLKQIEKAQAELIKLINEYPHETRFYSLLAESYMNSNQLPKALEVYTKIEQIDPTDDMIHMALANYYRIVNQEEKMFEYLHKSFANPLVSIDSKISVLYLYYRKTEQLKQVDTVLMQRLLTLSQIVTQAHPSDAKGYAMYGDYLYREKQLEAARTQFMLSLNYNQGEYAVWQQLMFINSELKDFNALDSISKDAISVYPEQPLAYLFNGLALVNLNKYAEAVIPFNQGKDMVFNNDRLLAQFHTYLGDVYNKLKQPLASDSAYESALLLFPSDAYTLNNYSYNLSLRKDKLVQAKTMSEKAIRLEPQNSFYLDTHAWVLFVMGDYLQAQKVMEEALKYGGDKESIIVEHYGDILYKLGDIEQSHIYWLKAKELPDNSPLLEEKIKTKQLIEQ